MGKSLLLLGSGGSIKRLPLEVINYVDETWGVNNLYKRVPARWTRWWEIHRFDFKDGRWLRKTESLWRGMRVSQYIEEVDALGIPVYVQSLPSPFKNYVPLNPNTQYRNYMGLTFAYQMNQALKEDFTEIHIYGVDLETPGEYANERPCAIYWVGLAEGRGIKVFVEGPLFKKDYFYAFNVREESYYEDRILQKSA